MNKKTFGELVAYLKNRPEEAKRLVEVLSLDTPAKAAESVVWISANVAGKMIGVSGTWMRRHLEWFPDHKRVGRGNGKFCYRFDRERVMPCYQDYINNFSL